VNVDLGMWSPTVRTGLEWGVGVDIEEIGKFEKALKGNKRFFTRTFSKGEVKYCTSKSNPAVCYAGTFAAKESVFKATNSFYGGPKKIDDFEIVRSGAGAPNLRWLRSTPKNKQRPMVRVSISHAGAYAVALAVAMIGDD
jgi:holo-[acyl-carrier protein] synthase